MANTILPEDQEGETITQCEKEERECETEANKSKKL